MIKKPQKNIFEHDYTEFQTVKAVGKQVIMFMIENRIC